MCLIALVWRTLDKVFLHVGNKCKKLQEDFSSIVLMPFVPILVGIKCMQIMCDNVTVNRSSSLCLAIRWSHDTRFIWFKYHCCKCSSYFRNYSNFSESFTPFKKSMSQQMQICYSYLSSFKKVIFIYICYINDIFQNVHAAF